MDDRTDLEKTRHSKVYRERLRRCRLVLLAWEASQPLRAEALVTHPMALDCHLAHFVQFCRDAGKPLYIAKHVVLGMMLRHRSLKGALARTWDALKSWEAKVSWSPRKPFTETLINHAFVTAFDMGMAAVGDARYLFVLIGAILRLAFYGLLRPGEFLAAYVGDLLFCDEPGMDFYVILAIRDPKTKAWLGRAQFSTIRHGPTGAWLRWLLVGRSPGEPLWPGSPALFRRMAKAIFVKAGLEDLHFTLGSCRPGGATFYFLKGTPVEQLQFMGRWRAVTSLKAYIQEAMSVLVWHRLPPAELDNIRSRLARAVRLLEGPPPAPWTRVLGCNGLSLPWTWHV